MINGTVINADNSQAVVDGPTVVNVELDSGEIVETRIESGETACLAEFVINGFNVKKGDYVQVYGEVVNDTYIRPCALKEHYFQVIQP